MCSESGEGALKTAVPLARSQRAVARVLAVGIRPQHIAGSPNTAVRSSVTQRTDGGPYRIICRRFSLRGRRRRT